MVYAVFDEDDLVVVHESAAYLNGLADGGELTSSVLRHDNGVGAVVERRGFTVESRLILTVGFQERHFLADGVSQQACHGACPEDVVMCVVLLSLRFARMLSRLKPHVEFFRVFRSHLLFQLVGDAVGIDEMDVEALRHVLRSLLI